MTIRQIEEEEPRVVPPEKEAELLRRRSRLIANIILREHNEQT